MLLLDFERLFFEPTALVVVVALVGLDELLVPLELDSSVVRVPKCGRREAGIG